VSHQSLTLPDGQTIAWREAGSGPPLVLIHGWSMSSAVFVEAIEALAPGFRVLAPDLRGHGYSSPGNEYALPGLAGDVLRWLDALEIPSCGLLGWSLGGQVAMRLAVDHPERFTRLALVCATPRFCSGDDWDGGLPPTQVRVMERNLRRDFNATLVDFFYRMFAGETIPPARFQQILRASVRSVPPIRSEVTLGALQTLRDADLRETAASLNCPTLVHYGSLDAITPPEAGAWLSRAIPGCREARVEGVGHAPFFARPDPSFALWREFFA